MMNKYIEYPGMSAVHAVDSSRRLFLSRAAALFAAAGSMLTMPQSVWALDQQPTTYTQTIAVLSLLYRGEVEAMLRYKRYQLQALKEGHVNIAHLFAAIAASESVHMKNFSGLLQSLGVNVPSASADRFDIRVGTTRENLRYATDVELSEIDVHYPQYLEQIRAEQHGESLQQIEYAWKAERQHRELIKEIQSGTGFFFAMLLRRFRASESRYFICQHCGSTLTVLPEKECPICGFAVSWYKEIPRPSV